MTLTELLEQAKKLETPEQIESMELDLAAAQEILRQKKAKHAPAKAEDDLTIKEAAAEMSIHWKTAYKFATRRNDPLPTVKYGGAVRVPRVPFQAWRKREAERGR